MCVCACVCYVYACHYCVIAGPEQIGAPLSCLPGKDIKPWNSQKRKQQPVAPWPTMTQLEFPQRMKGNTMKHTYQRSLSHLPTFQHARVRINSYSQHALFLVLTAPVVTAVTALSVEAELPHKSHSCHWLPLAATLSATFSNQFCLIFHHSKARWPRSTMPSDLSSEA